jgi:hypothetical protein
MLTEESNSSKAGYASSVQARFSLSFKTKVRGIFADRSAKNRHNFADISEYIKWESTGIKKGFRYQVEDGVKALESSLLRRVNVNTTQKLEAHRIFLTLLRDSVQHMLKLHRMMDGQFMRYRNILGASSDESHWNFRNHFAETVFAGTWRAILTGSDDFSETWHTRCAMYLWAALQTHIIL